MGAHVESIVQAESSSSSCPSSSKVFPSSSSPAALVVQPLLSSSGVVHSSLPAGRELPSSSSSAPDYQSAEEDVDRTERPRTTQGLTASGGGGGGDEEDDLDMAISFFTRIPLLKVLCLVVLKRFLSCFTKRSISQEGFRQEITRGSHEGGARLYVKLAWAE